MKPYYADESMTLWHGDALTILSSLPDASVNCAVTSPPYFGLRDYGVEGQLGLEASPAEYVENLRALFAQVRRVLADDGTLWLNLGDSYSSRLSGNAPTNTRNKSGHTARSTQGVPKNLLGIPWRVAFALQDEGWILRNAIVWNKTNAMPESVTDRLSTRYEMFFMFSKSARYWFDLDPIREAHLSVVARAPDGTDRGGYDGNDDSKGTRAGVERYGHLLGKNPGDVWSIPTSPTPFAHFATFPLAVPSRATQAGCKPGGTVLDPFSGSGTTGLAAARHGRKYIGIDLNAEYLDLSLRTRLAQPGLNFGEPA